MFFFNVVLSIFREYLKQLEGAWVAFSKPLREGEHSF